MSLQKQLLRKVGKAVHDFDMIREGDRIAVGVSGGKDSLALLDALLLLQKRSPVPFQVEAFTVEDALENVTHLVRLPVVRREEVVEVVRESASVNSDAVTLTFSATLMSVLLLPKLTVRSAHLSLLGSTSSNVS